MRGRNEKRQAQKTSPRKTKKGEAKIAVKQADKKRLVFLLGFVGKQQIYKKQQICDFGYIYYRVLNSWAHFWEASASLFCCG